MTNYQTINPEELEILDPDRISFLISSVLEHIATDKSGWSKLYRIPFTHQLWELDYPQSHTHGGGQARFRAVQLSDIGERYNVSLRSE